MAEGSVECPNCGSAVVYAECRVDEEGQSIRFAGVSVCDSCDLQSPDTTDFNSSGTVALGKLTFSEAPESLQIRLAPFPIKDKEPLMRFWVPNTAARSEAEQSR